MASFTLSLNDLPVFASAVAKPRRNVIFQGDRSSHCIMMLPKSVVMSKLKSAGNVSFSSIG